MTIAKTRIPTIVIALLITTVLAAGCTAPARLPAGSPASAARAAAAPGNQPTGISVQGEGSVTVAPDLAEVWLGVQITDPSLAAALKEANLRMNRVMEELTSLGVAEKDIKTVRFTVFPEYGRDQTLTGYRVDNTVAVRSKAIDRVGELLDGVVEAGANRVERISFTVEDAKPLAAKAREEAMADAKAKAEQLAQLAGVRLGRPTLVTESGGVVPPSPIFFGGGKGGEAFAAEPSISPGEMEITVYIQVTYAIE